MLPSQTKARLDDWNSHHVAFDLFFRDFPTGFADFFSPSQPGARIPGVSAATLWNMVTCPDHHATPAKLLATAHNLPPRRTFLSFEELLSIIPISINDIDGLFLANHRYPPPKKLMYIFNHIHLSSPRLRRTCIGTFGRCFLLLLLGLLQTFGDHSVQAVFLANSKK